MEVDKNNVLIEVDEIESIIICCREEPCVVDNESNSLHAKQLMTYQMVLHLL